MSSEYVYIVRPREFIRLEEETYKIGKTTQSPNSRLAGYPKGSEVLAFVRVNDCSSIETIIKERFIEIFTQRKEYGVEYFTGDIDRMLEAFMNIISGGNKCQTELPECDACQDTGLSYWSDGIYGDCMDCYRKCDPIEALKWNE